MFMLLYEVEERGISINFYEIRNEAVFDLRRSIFQVSFLLRAFCDVFAIS